MDTINKREKEKRIISTRTLVAIALGGALSFILMALDFPVPLVPPFVKFDFSDLPALILSFAFGPLAGIIIELLKNILYILFKGTSSAGVGELSNFILGASFVGTAGLIYKKNRTKKGAVLSVIAGSLVFSILGIFSNLYVMFPFYINVMGMPLDAIVAMGAKISPILDSELKLILYSITPFNLVKTFLVSGVTLLLYKKLSPILHKNS
ncbi:MAG: ECF transporter S component [Oscillospiraceae bacterium]